MTEQATSAHESRVSQETRREMPGPPAPVESELIRNTLLMMLFSAVAIVAVVFTYHRVYAVRIGTIDMPQLINLAREDIGKKLLSLDAGKATGKEAEVYLEDFVKKLDVAVGEVSANCQCVLLLKQAVVNKDHSDFTQSVRAKLGL